MKRTQKRVLGLLGLVLVAAMTIVAAFMPSPTASATTSVTDTIMVRVLDEVPSVEITSPLAGELVSSLNEPITVSYTNTKNFTITVTYVDENGVEHTETIADVDTPDEVGEQSFSFRDMGEEYGYGKYTVKITGEGLDGSAIEDTIQFEYVAVTADATVDEDNGVVNVDLGYDTDDDGIDEDNKVAKIEVNVYDENGNLVSDISPIVVDAPTKHVEIPFDEYGLPSGDYTITVQPYNAKGQELYRMITLKVRYDELLVPSTADTGGLFKNLNISQTDYLVTGLLVFGVVGIGGAIFISRRGKSSSRRRK